MWTTSFYLVAIAGLAVLVNCLPTVTDTVSAISERAAQVAKIPMYDQCGGIGWTGGSACEAGSACTEL